MWPDAKHERGCWGAWRVPAQELNHFRGQADGSGFIAVLYQLPPFHRAALGNSQCSFLNIKVTPFQSNQLSLPKSGCQCQQEHWEMAEPLRRVQIVLHFRRRQHIGADLLGFG